MHPRQANLRTLHDRRLSSTEELDLREKENIKQHTSARQIDERVFKFIQTLLRCSQVKRTTIMMFYHPVSLSRMHSSRGCSYDLTRALACFWAAIWSERSRSVK